VMAAYRELGVVEQLYCQGDRLRAGVRAAIERHGLGGYVEVIGRSCNLVYSTRDQERQPSQPFRTLFLQETLRRGVLAPSFVVNYGHDDGAIDETIEAVDGALGVYRKALEDGVEVHLVGRPVRPVMRPSND